MKKFILSLLCFSLVSMVAKAQFNPEVIDFESVTNSLIHIDTANHANLWQIGRPQKTLFNSAITPPNAIVTDTLLPYPINTNSSFQFTVYDSTFILSGSNPTWSWNYIYFSFEYEMDSDTLHDGGYVEFSLDSGQTWHDIAPWNSMFYYQNTLFNGRPAITGHRLGPDYRMATIPLCAGLGGPTIPHSIDIRFTFASDSINTNKEGWLIDNIWFGVDICSGIHEASKANTVTAYPVPASTSIAFQSDEVMKNATLIIYDDKGQKVKTIENINGTQWNLTNQNFSSGIYFYQLFNAHRWSASGKFIFQ